MEDVDPEVVMAGDAGIPLVRDGPQSPAARAFGKLVQSILAGDFPYASTLAGG